MRLRRNTDQSRNQLVSPLLCYQTGPAAKQQEASIQRIVGDIFGTAKETEQATFGGAPAMHSETKKRLTAGLLDALARGLPTPATAEPHGQLSHIVCECAV